MRGCKRLDGWPFSTRNSSHCGVTLSMRAVSNRWHISHFQQLEFNTSPMPEFLSPFAIRHLGRPLVCFSLLLFQSLPAGIRQRNRWRHGAKVTHPPSVTAVTSSSRFLTWRVPESLLGGRYRQSAIIFRPVGSGRGDSIAQAGVAPAGPASRVAVPGRPGRYRAGRALLSRLPAVVSSSQIDSNCVMRWSNAQRLHHHHHHYHQAPTPPTPQVSPVETTQRIWPILRHDRGWMKQPEPDILQQSFPNCLSEEHIPKDMFQRKSSSSSSSSTILF